jgi:hypothetical protein
MSDRETEYRPHEGAHLEIWLDIVEVGEPIQAFFQPNPTGGTDMTGDQMLAEYLAAVEKDGATDVCLTVKVIEGQEWVLHASDDGVGDCSYWVKFRD